MKRVVHAQASLPGAGPGTLPASLTPTCSGHHGQDVGSYEGPGLQDEGPAEECVSPVGLRAVGHWPLGQGRLQHWHTLPCKDVV